MKELFDLIYYYPTKPISQIVMNITHSNSCILISKLREIDATKITLKLLTHPSTSFLL